MENNRYQEIAKEHAAIRGTMRQIEAELDQLIARPARPEEEWRLPELVRTFRDHLKRHFALEEGGGLLGDANEYYDPGSRRKVEELIAEHGEFRSRIDRLADELLGNFVPAEVVQSCFDRDLRRLIADLGHHEAVENALLQDLVCRDLGAGD